MDRDSARRSQRAAGRADALTLATVAAGHRKAPEQRGSGHRGGRGAGSIVGVGVGIFAGVIGIIASVAGVAVLDRANRLRALQDLACQIKYRAAVGLIGYQIARRDPEQVDELRQLSPGWQFAVTKLLHGPRAKGLFAGYPIGRIAIAPEHGRDIDPRPHNKTGHSCITSTPIVAQTATKSKTMSVFF